MSLITCRECKHTALFFLVVLLFPLHAAHAEIHTWTDASGKFTEKAEFIRMYNKIVCLEKSTGKRISVPLERLSKKDQNFVRQVIAAKMDRYFKQMKTRQKRVLEYLDENIKSAKKIAKYHRSLPRPSNDIELAVYMENIADSNQELCELEEAHKRMSQKYPHITFNDITTKLGQIGVLYNDDAVTFFTWIVQIRNSEEMFVKQYVVNTTTEGFSKRGPAFRPQEGDKMGQRLLIRGISTKGITDNSSFELKQLFQVTDTETYTTTDGGSSTVFVLEPISFDEYLQYAKQK